MPNHSNVPGFLASAQSFYGEAFDHQKKKALARSMADWAEMDEEERSFAAAHLAFLNLQAQAATQKLLTQVRDLLDEVAESLSAALEASLPDEDDEDEEEDDELRPEDVPDDDAQPPALDNDAPEGPMVEAPATEDGDDGGAE